MPPLSNSAFQVELAASHDEPQGLLRVTAPLDIGNTLMPDVIVRFATTYPKVRLELITDDRKVDLLGEGFDLAIRAAVLQDSPLIARRIGRACAQAFASPNYVTKHGMPKHPRELANHLCVQLLPMGRERWRLTNGKQTLDVPMAQRCLISDRGITRQLALADRGVALIPSFMCRGDVEAERLVEVLQGWHTPYVPVHFVYPPQKFVPPQLTAFMNMVMPTIRGVLATEVEA